MLRPQFSLTPSHQIVGAAFLPPGAGEPPALPCLQRGLAIEPIPTVGAAYMPPAFLVMLLLLASVTLTAICPPALSAPNNAWKIEYVANPFNGGGNTVWMTSDAFKITTKNQYAVFAKAPDWAAKVCNMKTKSICIVPPETYIQGRLFFENEETVNEFSPKDIVSTESITSFGLRAQRQSWQTVSDDPNFYRNRRKPVRALTQLTTTKEIPHNKMQIALFAAWIPIPHLTAVPLTLVDKQENGVMQGRYYATSVQKVSVSPKEFIAPTDYKKVARASQLFSQQYSGYFKFLDIEENPGRKPAR